MVERISSENLVEAMEELDRRLGALTPDAPEGERAALAEIPSRHLPPSSPVFDTANWLRPQPTASSSWTRSRLRGLQRAQQDVWRIEHGIEAIGVERAQRENAAAAPSKSSTSRLTPTQRHSF